MTTNQTMYFKRNMKKKIYQNWAENRNSKFWVFVEL